MGDLLSSREMPARDVAAAPRRNTGRVPGIMRVVVDPPPPGARQIWAASAGPRGAAELVGARAAPGSRIEVLGASFTIDEIKHLAFPPGAVRRVK